MASDSHYYIPIIIKKDALVFPGWALVDTGATKCMIPKIINKLFNFPIDCTDNVNTATENSAFDTIIIPELLFIYVLDGKGKAVNKENIEAWLGDRFILGMNFLRYLNISMYEDILTITV